MTHQPLHEVTLLCPFPGGYGDPLYDSTYEHITERAASLGATIVRDPDGNPTLHRKLLKDPHAYTLLGSNPLVRSATEKLLRSGRKLGVAAVDVTPYPATRRREIALPFVLASRALSGGKGKYLIENREQLARVRALLDKKQPLLNDLGEPYEVRKFIDTPSSHYTSYRVITTPEGIIAAGLLYSAHTKGEERRIRHVTPRRAPITLATNMWGESCRTAFEDPRSPLFLNAQNVCSNIEQGGGCIPLMGDNRRSITDQEATILEAHRIDPERPALPERIRRPALVVAHHIGRLSGLVHGADFLDNQQLTTGWFLEHNTGPGGATWNECWNGGAANLPEEIAIRQMHDAALDTLVAARS